MNVDTTTLVAEIVFGGALIEVAGILAVDSLTGGALLEAVGTANAPTAALLAAVAVVLTYYLGSILNTVSRALFKPMERRCQRAILGRGVAAGAVRDMRLRIFSRSDALRDHVDSVYAQVRVFRMGAVGFLLLGVACLFAPVFLDSRALRGSAVVAALAVTLGSLLGLYLALKSYYRVLRDADKLEGDR